MERYNLLVSGEIELGDRTTAYGEFRMSRNVTEVRNGAAPAFFQVSGAAFLAELDEEFGTDFQNSAYMYIARWPACIGQHQHRVFHGGWRSYRGG